MIRLPALAIAAVVLLRLLTGWHFFNEGVKKLDPSFTSAGFLRTAKGPFAPLFRSMVPGPYGAHVDLARPVELGSRPAEQRRAIDAWVADYGRRLEAARAADEPAPSDIDPVVPGAEWIENLRAGWDAGVERLGEAGLDDEQRAVVQSLRDAKLGQVVQYLHSILPEIEDLQHEEWRLQKKRREADPATAPFQQELIDDKATEVWRTMQPWIASVRQIEESLVESIASETGLAEPRVRAALAERSTLSYIDLAVKVTVLGCGVCVFLGLGTPVFAVIASLFLVSLMLTQPPWVAGADMAAFFAWSIEAAAFLVLAALGAGAWAGVDGLLYRLLKRAGGREPRYDVEASGAEPAATG